MNQRAELFPFQILEKGANDMKQNNRLVCINIVTADPKRLAAFYQDVLGAQIEESHGGPNRIEIWFGPKNDSTVCIVANYDAGFQKQTYHACQGFEFRVDDVDGAYERICALGIKAEEAPRDLPWGFRFFHIKDPDGNGIDLVQALGEE